MITGESENFRCLKPGALHKARWVAKLLYAMKMVLLSSKIEVELPPSAVFEASKGKWRKRKDTQLDKPSEGTLSPCHYTVFELGGA